jgi:hypothetical protein
MNDECVALAVENMSCPPALNHNAYDA